MLTLLASSFSETGRTGFSLFPCSHLLTPEQGGRSPPAEAND